MTNTLEGFKAWSLRNSTHMDRHLSILRRQSDVFRDYVELIKSRPANSDEFLSEVMKLHQRVNLLVEEMKETNDSFVDDCNDFQVVLCDLKLMVLNRHE